MSLIVSWSPAASISSKKSRAAISCAGVTSGSCSARRLRTSSAEAMPRFVSAASAATMARPHALVSAFCSSEPRVKFVFPGYAS